MVDPSRLSLRAKVTLSSAVLVFTVTFAASLALLYFAEDNMRSVIATQQFSLIKVASAHLDASIRSRQAALTGIAQTLSNDTLRDPQQFRQRVNAQRALSGQFSAVVLVDRDGKITATSREFPTTVPTDVSRRPYFLQAIAERRMVMSEPLLSALSSRPIVLLATPLFGSDQSVSHVLVGSIDLQSGVLVDEIESARPGKTGHTFIMTADGLLLSHPDKRRLLQHIHSSAGMNRATQRALQGYEGWIEAGSSETLPGIYAYKKMQTTGWMVGARYPSDEAFAPIIAVRRFALAGSVLFALLGAAAAWFWSGRLLRPFSRLRQAVMAMRASPVDGAARVAGQADEVSDLSQAFHDVMAEREAVSQQRFESELLIRTILQRAPDAFIIVDDLGRIIEWNAQAEKTFGWTRDEVLERNVVDLIVPDAQRSPHFAGKQDFLLAGMGALAKNRVRIAGQRKNGEEVQLEVSIGTFEHREKKMMAAFLHDVSERVAHEHRIAASEKRARMIADSMPALIAYVDRSLRYRFTNAHCETMLGITPEAMLGQTMESVLGAETFATLTGHIAKALSGQRAHFEHKLDRGQMSSHVMVDYVPDIDEHAGVQGFYVMKMDISERKKAELRAQAANRAKSDFVANISHEIRTPMNAVLGISQLLAQTRLTSEQAEYVELIRSSGSSLLNILNDVLDFSKVEAGKMQLDLAPFALADVIDPLASLMGLQAGANHLEVAFSMGDGLPATFIGDAQRLRQVLINLIGNAIKFTLHGYVTLRVEGEPVAPAAPDDPPRWTVAFIIEDSGIGIAPEQHDRVFSSFAQADTSTTRRFAGTGLGLAISTTLVELMGGSISLSSVPGQGSTFTVRLPLQCPDAHRPQAPAAMPVCLVTASDLTRSCCASLLQITTAPVRYRTALADALLPSETPTSLESQSEFLIVDSALIAADRRGFETLLRGANPSQVFILATPHERNTLSLSISSPHVRWMLRPMTLSSLAVLAADTRSARQRHLPASTATTSKQRIKVLLVEDNKVNQVVAKGMLKQLNLDVATAANGEQAVSMMAADGASFSLVLMDVQMPVMDGFQATRLIKADLGLNIPILAMSAGVTSGEQSRCLEVGMDDFIAKPIEIETLREVVARHLTRAGLAHDMPTYALSGARLHLETTGIFEPSFVDAMGGRADLRMQAVAALEEALTKIPDDVQAILAACRNGEQLLAHRKLHALRGATGILGSIRLAKACQALETALMASHGSTAEHEHVVEDEAALLCQVAGEWLATQAHGGAGAATEDVRELGAHLSTLRRLLADHDFAAHALFERIKLFLAQCPDLDLAKLQDAMDNLDFEDARALLQSAVDQ